MDFCVGKLESLDNQEQEYEIVNDEYLKFYITGEFNNQKYSLEFITKKTLRELRDIDQNITLDFNDGIDYSDIVFGINGVFDVDVEGNFTICRYLDNNYLIKAKLTTEEYFITTDVYFEI